MDKKQKSKITAMQITLLAPAHPYRGGIAAFTERLAHEMQKEGDEVKIETFTLQYPSFLFPGKTQYTDSPAPEDLNIVRTINSCNPFNWIKMGLRLKQEAPDLLVLQFWHPFMAPCMGTIARIARSNGKTKAIAVLHNILPHEPGPFDKICASYLVKMNNGFVALSDSVLEDTNKFDTHKPKAVSPHPLYDNFGQAVSREEALTHLQLPTEQKYMLFFGFIRPYKGLDLLMQAFAHPYFKENNIKLIVAGEFYEGEEQYRQLEKDLGLEGQIIWKNIFIPDDEVKHYFCAADIIVQPYKSATQSGVTQIAYHFEKPMLVTRVGGLPEIVPHQKVGYVTDVQASDITEALQDFYQNERTEEFMPHIKTQKAKYAWSAMTHTIKTLLAHSN